MGVGAKRRAGSRLGAAKRYSLEPLEQRLLLSGATEVLQEGGGGDSIQVVSFDRVTRTAVREAAEPAADPVLAEHLARAGFAGVGDLIAALGEPAAGPAGKTVRVTPADASGAGEVVRDRADTESVFGPDDRTQVGNTGDFPWRTLGRVAITFPDGTTGHGSGVMISPYHFLTAGHCIHDAGHGGFATGLAVSLGQANATDRPFGTADWTEVRTYANWTDSQSSDHDWALITLDRNIGNFTGWLGYEARGNVADFNGMTVNTAGYPGDKPTGTMWTAAGTTDSATDTRVFYNDTLDTFGGQSGSGVWRFDGTNRYVNVVHTTGGATTNGGTRINSEKFNRLGTWMGQDTAPADRPDLVDYDDWFRTDFRSFSPSAVSPGGVIGGRTVVRNNGTAAAGAHTVSFYASANTTINSSDYLLGTRSVASLAALNFADLTWSGTVPANTPAGSYYVGWVIDSGGTQAEFNESNNTGVITASRLTVGGGGGLTPDRFEANDSFAAATNLGTLGDVTENNLSIHASGNADFYRFTAAAAGTLNVSLAFSHALGDVDMTLYNASQGFITDSAGTTNTEQLTTTVVAGQTYYLSVNGYSGATNPDYDLVIDGPQLPGDRFEPNDSFAAATNLGSLGDRTENNLSIHAPGNGDFYRFTAAADGTLNVSLAFSHALGDIDMVLYNASQGAITSSGGTSDTEQLSTTVAAGATYYLEVYGYSGATNLDYDLVIDGPAVAQNGSISGTVWNDADGDRVFDGGEGVLPGWVVFLDQDNDQTLDAGERSTTSDAQGNYTFGDLPAGTYSVCEVIQPGWEQTHPGGVARAAPVPLPPAPKTATTGSAAPAFLIGSEGETTPGGDGAGDIKPLDAQSNPLIRLTNFRADPRFAGINGTGYSVAVLDSGIDLNHPYFGPDANGNGVADRIVFHRDFADNDNDASDNNGHGSNVASIAAGQNTTHSGMAPGANIIALKVFRNDGGGTFAYTEAALQWVVANAAAYNITAVNMSLGDSGNYNTRAARYGLGDELAALAAMNVIVVSAAGNDYFQFNGQQGASYPASDPNSLSVSATYDANVGRVDWGSGATDFTSAADRVASFSQRSTTLTSIFAPGPFSTGANQSGGTVDQGGTSQASPHIAGIAVLAQQLAMQRLGRRLTAAEFTGLMQSSGVTINDGDDENDNVTNTGANYKRVDVFALGEAIYAMGGGGGDPPRTHRVVLAAGQNVQDVDFGNRLLAVNAPTVTQVYVRGTGWTTAYLNSLQTGGLGSGTFGYAVAGGADQHNELPWGNVNQVSVRFSEAVSVQQADLAVGNSLGATIAFATTGTPFAYDAATFTATWTLARAFANEKITLRLDGDAATGGVTDTDGTPDLLDGEWTNPTGTPAAGGRAYPSGNGTAGGDFVFSLRPLPGDFNRDGNVNLSDFGVLRANFGTGGIVRSVLQGDATGDGNTNLADFGILRGSFGRTTPA